MPIPIHPGDVVQLTIQLGFSHPLNAEHHMDLTPGTLVTVRQVNGQGSLGVETDWGAKLMLNQGEYRLVRLGYFISYSHKEGFGNFYSYRTSRLDSPKVIEAERREYEQAKPDFRGIVILNITQIGIEPYED